MSGSTYLFGLYSKLSALLISEQILFSPQCGAAGRVLVGGHRAAGRADRGGLGAGPLPRQLLAPHGAPADADAAGRRGGRRGQRGVRAHRHVEYVRLSWKTNSS